MANKGNVKEGYVLLALRKRTIECSPQMLFQTALKKLALFLRNGLNDLRTTLCFAKLVISATVILSGEGLD